VIVSFLNIDPGDGPLKSKRVASSLRAWLRAVDLLVVYFRDNVEEGMGNCGFLN
jgi:hypothetical protein